MAERAEIEDQVDLEDYNFIEEIDEFPEEPIEEEEVPEGGSQDIKSEDSGGKGSDLVEADLHKIPEDEENRSGQIDVDVVDDDEKKKHAELLAFPPHGSEVFIGGLPREATVGDLEDLCETISDIVEIRLVRNKDTGESKGFAFVTFKTRESAQQAIEELNNKDFKGRTLRCSRSESKYRLFIGNLPKNWTDDDFRKFVERAGPGVEVIELIKDPQYPGRNRGFGFLEYYNNACADYARLKMAGPDFKVDGNSPTVTWADPKNSSEHSSAAASQVKSLYVKNIPENASTEQVKQLFQHHGEITRVVLPPPKLGGKKDFGFVHYAERSSALKAVKETEKYEIDGQVLDVCLAKPQVEKKVDGQHGNFNPRSGYGSFSGNSFGLGGPGYGGALQQPVIYGRGPMPAGMHMMPMVLPDGQIGYVLQQPGGVQMPYSRPGRNYQRNDNHHYRSNGSQSRGSSSGGNEDGNRGNKRHRPY